ncbi:hypothetical protein CGLO_07496 [Colletotrichum gloeosporioides Cg-14]|uniref:Uncharacterized protein n=1 Tax=Colletotrichum gloeosporioides (strain Cg-14) TaxID=1237896 RepID=T0KBS7_COLGC|nr:hypothetical protein CGLO_07496 [Colletotrichum gloeosporioides Cg-14]
MKETISEAYTPQPELLDAARLSSTILLPLPSGGDSSAMAVLRNRADVWTIDLFDPTANVVSDNVQEMIESFFKHHLPEVEEIPKCILCSCPSLLRLADQAVYAFAIGLHALVSVPLPRKLPDRLWRLVLVSVLNVDLEATEWKQLVPKTRVSPQPRVSEHLPNSMSTAQQVVECMRIAEECRRWQSRLEIQMKQTVRELQQVAADVASVSTVIALLLRGGGAQTESRDEEEIESTASTRKELQDAEAHLGSLKLQLNEEMSDHKRLIKDIITASKTAVVAEAAAIANNGGGEAQERAVNSKEGETPVAAVGEEPATSAEENREKEEPSVLQAEDENIIEKMEEKELARFRIRPYSKEI